MGFGSDSTGFDGKRFGMTNAFFSVPAAGSLLAKLEAAKSAKLPAPLDVVGKLETFPSLGNTNPPPPDEGAPNDGNLNCDVVEGTLLFSK